MMRKLSFLIVIVCSCCRAFGQVEIPYSRYGLGILQQPQPAFLRGWANQSTAFHNAYNLNFMNPASYSYLTNTVFEAGLFGSSMKIKTVTDSQAVFGDGGIATLALGFPVIKNKLGLSFGLTPFSRVNYDIIQVNDSVPGLGYSENYFQGTGQLYTFYLGSGYKWKNLSIGVNAQYLFGKLDYNTVLAFPEAQNSYNTLRNESRVIGDIIFTGGLQYRQFLDDKKVYALDFGLTGNLQSNLNATRNLMYVRFIYSQELVDSIPIPRDTISNVSDSEGKIVLPMRYSAGLIFSKASHYMIGVTYDFGKWSDYSSFGEKDLTGNSWRLSAGIQIIPDYKSYTQYLKVVAYRAGFSMGKNYLEFNGKELPEYEANLGIGFPLKRVLSELSLSGEFTHLGSLKENPLAISTFRITLGVTLNDRWFQKRKFD